MTNESTSFLQTNYTYEAEPIITIKDTNFIYDTAKTASTNLDDSNNPKPFYENVCNFVVKDSANETLMSITTQYKSESGTDKDLVLFVTPRGDVSNCISMLFKEDGTKHINVCNATISNVKSPSENTDAVNKGYVDAHANNTIKHITGEERELWNAHANNTIKHITGEERELWNGHIEDDYLHKPSVANNIVTNMPIGSICWFNRTTAPTGWLICNGQWYSNDGREVNDTQTDTCINQTPNLIGKYPLGATSGIGDPVAAGIPDIFGKFPGTEGSEESIADDAVAADDIIGFQDTTVDGELMSVVYSDGGATRVLYKNKICVDVPNDGTTNTDSNVYSFYASRGQVFEDETDKKTVLDQNDSRVVYGKSNTVQPPSVKLLPCIKVYDADTEDFETHVANAISAHNLDPKAHADELGVIPKIWSTTKPLPDVLNGQVLTITHTLGVAPKMVFAYISKGGTTELNAGTTTSPITLFVFATVPLVNGEASTTQIDVLIPDVETSSNTYLTVSALYVDSPSVE